MSSLAAETTPHSADRELLDALPAAVLIAESGTVAYANYRAVEILSTALPDLLGRSLDAAFGVPGFTDRDQPEGSPRDERLARVGGSVLGLTSSVVGDREIYVFRDISHVETLRTHHDRLLRIAAIGEALPSLLHELKNPLAAITTTVEVLLEELPTGETQSTLHAVLSELRRMALSFDGLGAVNRHMHSNRFGAIDYSCSEACKVLAARAEQAGIVFRFEISQMPLLPIDPAVVRALVFNFVINAIQACDKHDAIRLKAWFDPKRTTFELSVVDTGRGMSPTVLDQATDLFYTTKANGSGIGLALCKRVVEEANGTIELTSVPGFGSRVSVSVPAMLNPPKARLQS